VNGPTPPHPAPSAAPTFGGYWTDPKPVEQLAAELLTAFRHGKGTAAVLHHKGIGYWPYLERALRAGELALGEPWRVNALLIACQPGWSVSLLSVERVRRSIAYDDRQRRTSWWLEANWLPMPRRYLTVYHEQRARATAP